MDEEAKKNITDKYYATKSLLATLFEYATINGDLVASAADLAKEAEDTLDSMYDEVQATFLGSEDVVFPRNL